MPNPTCGVHGTEMTWKTGVSKKTGKSYAFWACGVYDQNSGYCQYKAPQGSNPAPQPIPHVPTPQYVPPAPKPPQNAPQRTTDDNIARSVALKAAVDFYAGKTTTQEAVVHTATIFLGFLKGEGTQSVVKAPAVQVQQNEPPLPVIQMEDTQEIVHDGIVMSDIPF